MKACVSLSVKTYHLFFFFFFPQLSTRFPLPCVKKVLFQEAASLEISLLLGENLSQSLLLCTGMNLAAKHTGGKSSRSLCLRV